MGSEMCIRDRLQTYPNIEVIVVAARPGHGPLPPQCGGATVELLGKILGTADLLGQMADRYYLEKLPDLFDEFAEAGITTFAGPLDLLDKTQGFYQMTLKRFAEELDNTLRFSRFHFRKRWGIDEDLYIKSIEKNMAYLARVVTLHRETYTDHLRRFARMTKE